MAERLVDLYRPGQAVQIYLAHTNGWQPGRITRLDHPAVWVQTEDGRQWFVTNRRHIRPEEIGRR